MVSVEKVAFVDDIGDVEGKAPIEADDEESQVIAQTDTCAEGKVVEEVPLVVVHQVNPQDRGEGLLLFFVECGVIEVVRNIDFPVFAESPDVARVEKNGTFQVSEDGRTVMIREFW